MDEYINTLLAEFKKVLDEHTDGSIVIRRYINDRVGAPKKYSSYDRSIPYEHRWKGYVETPDPSIHWTVPPCSG